MPDKEGSDDEKKSTKSVVNKRQKQMMGEEGYDVARDMGRVKPSKDKKDATTMPPSKEMEKTRKVNKGPSALERVKKKYKGQIMDVKKEELDLTQVAEAFGGFIIEKKDKQFKQGKLFKFKSGAQGEIASGSPEMGGESEKFVKGKKKKFNILTDPDPDADSLAAKSETDKGVKQQVDKEINKAKAAKNLKSKVKTGTTKAGEDASKIAKKTPTTTPKITGDKTFVSPDPISKPDLRKTPTKRIDLRTVKKKISRKATPKELERTKAQVAAIDTKEKRKTMQGKSGKGRIQIPRGEGQIRTFKGFKQRTQRSIVKTGKQFQKAVAPVAKPVAAAAAKAGPLPTAFVGLEVAKITPGLKRFFAIKPPLPPAPKGGKVGRRTAG